MPSERAERVRSALFDEWRNEGGPGPPGAVENLIVNWLTPDFELISMLSSERGEPYHGHQGVREWFEDIGHMFERFEPVAKETLEQGDRVVFTGHVDLRVRGQAESYRDTAAWIVDLDDGKMARLEV